MIREGVIGFAITVFLAAAAHADPDYKGIALKAYPVSATVTAQSVFIEDCGTPDSTGRVSCHSCYNELSLDQNGNVRDYADRNLQVIDANGAPHLVGMRELAQQITHFTPDAASAERAKGSKPFAEFLSELFAGGDKWCEANGGERYELKNTINNVTNEGR